MVKRLIQGVEGVENVMVGTELDQYYRDQSGRGRRAGKARGAHDAERSGELVAVADSSSWFAYYYWMDDQNAPDFARCVAIHRKPGYDPAEMFFRYPGILGIAWLIFKLLLTYGLKLRTIVDSTPLRCDAIRGSHGALPHASDDPRPLIAFKARVRGSSAAACEPVPAGGTPLGPSVSAASALGESRAEVEPLGPDGCILIGDIVVAEDVYEILWRILKGEI